MLQLPNEVFAHILHFLDPDLSSVPTLLACSSVSKNLHVLAADPLIWTAHASRWSFPDRRFDLDPADSYEYYKARHQVDSQATRRIHELARSSSHRLDHLEQIVKAGAGLYDCLLALRRIEVAAEPEHYLSVRYWAGEAWAAIQRQEAITVWKRLRLEESIPGLNNIRDFEDGVMAFAAFRGANNGPKDLEAIHVPRRLDELAKHMDLSELRRTVGPPRQQLRERTTAILKHMDADLGLRSAQGMDFHALHNNFLDSVLSNALSPNTSEADRGTLPMSLVSIFCSLVNRLPADINMQARPIPVPGILMAGVAHRDAVPGSEDWLFVDIYGGGAFIPAEVLNTRFRNANLIFGPARASDMVRRVAANISTSIHHARAHSQGIHVSLYTATMARFLLGAPDLERQADWLVSLCQSDFPMDVAILEREVLPVLSGQRLNDTLDLCRSIRATDQHEPEVKRPDKAIQWPIGHVFVHRLFQYTAVIRGWDVSCEASEPWIQQMRVDSLPYGRNQPFYHVLVRDGSPRYVAQENITTLPEPSVSDYEDLLACHSVGKYFRKCVRNSDGRLSFVASAQLQAEYPVS